MPVVGASVFDVGDGVMCRSWAHVGNDTSGVPAFQSACTCQPQLAC